MQLTVSDAAERLKVTPSYVRRKCRAGEIKAERFGRDWSITPEALEEFQKHRRPRGGRRKKSP